ncbi:MAG: serine hydrolase domain-containing protein [Caulobacteraceae bacterium]
MAARQIGEVNWTWRGRAFTLQSYMAAYHVSGVIALKDGQVVLETFGLGRGPADRWVSQSVAKSITSLLAGAAILQGKLDPDANLTTYVPELKGTSWDGVTFRQLAMMSAGVAWDENYLDPKADLQRYYDVVLSGGDEVAGFLGKLPRAHPPGSTFHYDTAEAHLAGLVVSRAVGMPLADYLSKTIWEPYGMERDALWMTDFKGREFAGCCLYATLADYARIGQFVLDGGRIEGAQVVDPAWLAASTRVEISNGRPPPFGYGYLWWIGPQAYEASGIYGQSIIVYPKDHLVIAINSAWDKPDDPDDFAALAAFQEAVRAAANQLKESAPR